MSYLDLGYDTWREDLERYRIEIVEDSEVLDIANLLNVLPVTNCSKNKSSREKSTPKYIYVSHRLSRFYKWCENYELEYGILSDLYGLCYHNEEIEVYDYPPSKLNSKLFRQLASKIYFQMDSRNYNSFLYYGLPPVSCRPYFKMMLITGMKIYYTTKLPE